MKYRIEYLKNNNLYDKKYKKPIFTDTSFYLLPMVNVGDGNFGIYFINAYINISNKDANGEIEPRLNIVCDIGCLKDDPNGIFNNALNTLKNNNCFIKLTEDHENEEIVIETIIPKKYHDDFYRFLNGKFSEFSLGYKEYLITLHGREIKLDNKVTMVSVLYPNLKIKGIESYKIKQLADSLGVDPKLITELKSKPNLYKEVFKTIDELKNEQYEQNKNKQSTGEYEKI